MLHDRAGSLPDGRRRDSAGGSSAGLGRRADPVVGTAARVAPDTGGELARVDPRRGRHRRNVHRPRPPRRGDGRRRPSQGGDDPACLRGRRPRYRRTDGAARRRVPSPRHDSRHQRAHRAEGRPRRPDHDRRLQGHPGDREGEPARPLQLRVPQADVIRAAPPSLRGLGADRLPGPGGHAARRGGGARGGRWPARRGSRGDRDLPAARVREPRARATGGGDRRRGVA